MENTVKETESIWSQDYITEVKPILIRDPFLELLGQTNQPIPYKYEEAVKLAGHSCGAVAGAWNITRKALETLYPNEVPVRGQIKITAPGGEDEWIIGVFGEIMMYITGAAPKSGFPGGEFGPKYSRRNKLEFQAEFSNLQPFELVWTFERIDNGAKVKVRYDVRKVIPQATPERKAMNKKMAEGSVTPEEASEWIEYWNARVKFVFENADTLEGLIIVEQV